MTNALPSNNYMAEGDTISLSMKKRHMRFYYFHAFNNAGASGFCIFTHYICGEETLVTADAYILASKPYTTNLAVNTASGSKYE